MLRVTASHNGILKRDPVSSTHETLAASGYADNHLFEDQF